jgi:hypothetical protein
MVHFGHRLIRVRPGFEVRHCLFAHGSAEFRGQHDLGDGAQQGGVEAAHGRICGQGLWERRANRGDAQGSAGALQESAAIVGHHRNVGSVFGRGQFLGSFRSSMSAARLHVFEFGILDATALVRVAEVRVAVVLVAGVTFLRELLEA